MSENGLEEELGVLAATSIGIGTMIGGGIFILPSVAVRQAGPASLISFAIGGIISLLAAFSHAELATNKQAAGGTYRYVHDSLGAFLGNITGWCLIVGLIFEATFYVVGFAQYLTFFGEIPIRAAAIALAVVLVGLNVYGTSETGGVQNVIVISLVVLLAAFVGTGSFSVETGGFSPFAPEGWTAVLSTAGTVYVAFIGFSLVATISEEVKNPARNVPIAMIASVVIPSILYLLVLAVSIGVLPLDELANSRIPVADVAQVFGGWLGGLAMTIGAVMATVASANSSILSSGRVALAMGSDKVLTEWFDTVHDSFETPYRGVLVAGVCILVLTVAQFGIDRLAEIASFLYLVTYGLGHVAVIRFRRDDDVDYDPSFRIPTTIGLYPLIPAVGILATIGIMTQMDPIVIGGGIGLIVLAIA